jgi:hypothetical protein
MSTGLLSNNLLALNTDTLCYTVPTGKTASFTVSICNQSPSSEAKIDMAITALGSSTANSYIEFQAVVPVSGVLERSAIVLGQGETVRVRSTNANTSVVIFGIEE